MKICHCVKMSDEEKKALQIISDMIGVASEDPMLDSAFEEKYGNTIKDTAWGIDALKEFLEGFGD